MCLCLCVRYESARSRGSRDCMLLCAVNGQELRGLSLSQPAIAIFPYSIVIVIQLGLELVPLQSSATRSFLPQTVAALNPKNAVSFTISSLDLYRIIDFFSVYAQQLNENLHRCVIYLLFFHTNFKFVSYTSLKS